ncbi:MAG TPA: methyltransferase domain-containing protein [Limnochordia bacterium]|nr:methyltransferase domain-containing protein [Limnochordia bacterium]
MDFSGSRILDIGAGPGSFAVPMAKLAREVVAIEPSEQMVNLMGSYAQEEGVSNLRIITASWDEQFALEDHGLGGKFELVFSSMNPGIVNWTTLEKAINMASKYCYISTFAGKRDNPALKELWTQLYREPMPPWPGEIFYIVNLLYTKGYQFSFKVWEETNQERLPVDEAARLLAEMLARYGGKNLEEVWEPTLAYVKSRANEANEFSQEISTRLGKILICL